MTPEIQAGRYSIIDVFADTPFTGNPAAVVEIDDTPTDEWMAAVARELACPNTAFVAVRNGKLALRWFTAGGAEVRICGHATIATAHHLATTQPHTVPNTISFDTVSGPLTVEASEGAHTLTLPTDPPEASHHRVELERALGAPVIWTGRNSNDLVAVLADQNAVATLTPDFTVLAALGGRGVIATAPGEEFDYVLRFFAPAVGIGEDNVTGTAHCALAPLWRDRFGKQFFTARQLSSRPGSIAVQLLDDARLSITAKSITIARGFIAL